LKTITSWTELLTPELHAPEGQPSCADRRGGTSPLLNGGTGLPLREPSCVHHAPNVESLLHRCLHPLLRSAMADRGPWPHVRVAHEAQWTLWPCCQPSSAPGLAPIGQVPGGREHPEHPPWRRSPLPGRCREPNGSR